MSLYKYIYIYMLCMLRHGMKLLFHVSRVVGQLHRRVVEGLCFLSDYTCLFYNIQLFFIMNRSDLLPRSISIILMIRLYSTYLSSYQEKKQVLTTSPCFTQDLLPGWSKPSSHQNPHLAEVGRSSRRGEIVALIRICRAICLFNGIING